MTARHVLAGDLRPGMVLVTRIGRAPVKSVTPRADGVEVVLDIEAPGSTRARAQGAVLFYWSNQAVRVAGKAPGSRVSSPRKGDRASRVLQPPPPARHWTETDRDEDEAPTATRRAP